MSKPLLNYTTSVEVNATVAQISKILIAHGAKSVLTRYGSKGVPEEVCFSLCLNHGEENYKLPARVDRVLSVLRLQQKKGLIQPRHATPEHAARVAWRIVKDWLEAQLALAESGLVDVEEVLLPYQLRDGRTFFEFYAQSRKAITQKGISDEL